MPVGGCSWAHVRYYGTLHGIPVIAVSPRFTPQDCSGCGFRVKKSLSMRTHICPHCGLVLDRDGNAALNILAAALVVVAHLRTAGQVGTGSGSPERSHFWTDRHDALCSQGHEALGLDEGRISRF